MRATIWNGRLFCALLLSSILIACYESEQTVTEERSVAIIPKPKKLELGRGSIEISHAVSISFPEIFTTEVEVLEKFLADQGWVSSQTDEPTIKIDRNSTESSSTSYSLEIDTSAISISAQSPEALSRAMTSLQQLILLSKQGSKAVLPQLKMQDQAAFSHRGLLLDCSRHFFSIEVLKKYVDLLALYKMNVLHWHLTEDQGWRLAIDAYPQLSQFAAYRIEEDGRKYGGYYSKEEVRELVAYAEKRHVQIIPEIELPGHSQAAIAAYPHLSCTGDSVSVANDWGVFKEIYCAGNDSVFQFLEQVLTEVVELFPSPLIHIGGDEAPKSRWEACSKCQKRMKEHGLHTEEELQSYFIGRVAKFLNSKGRRIIGWDEILEGGLEKTAILQSWRGVEGAVEAVEMGNEAILSPTSHAYLDYDLKAIDLKKVYSFYPVPEGISEDQSHLVLGGECNMWTEHVPNEKTLDQKVFPRMIAMSEVLWSDSTGRDFEEFNERLQQHYSILEDYGVNYGMESVPLNHQMKLEGNQAEIELTPYQEDIHLKYQKLCLDCDSSWNDYKQPIPVLSDFTLNIEPYKGERKYGENITIPLVNHLAINAAMKYITSYSDWYTAGGEKGMVDGKRGSLDFRDGSWQGFWGSDAVIEVDLKSAQMVSNVSTNFYQYSNSWIFVPLSMKVEYSLDGKNWAFFGLVESEADPKKRGKQIHSIEISLEEPIELRYLRLKVKNFGKVPDWHEAAGSDAWIFMDEIVVQ